jgi:hypothetical protein
MLHPCNACDDNATTLMLARLFLCMLMFTSPDRRDAV